MGLFAIFCLLLSIYISHSLLVLLYSIPLLEKGPHHVVRFALNSILPPQTPKC